MNTLVVFASIHGCTKKCAQLVAKKIIGKTCVINLKTTDINDLNNFSNIIIGGSIHTGHINPRIKLFFDKFLESLKNKNIGFFLCFMDSENKFEEYIKKSMPAELLNSVKVKGYFGGELDFKKMTFFEKLYIQKTTHIKSSVSNINKSSINDFCDKMNKFIGSN